MKQTKVFSLALGLILLSILVLPTNGSIKAQGSDNYTATWTATKIITVDSPVAWQAAGILRNVPIGVAEWQVDARSTNGGAQLFTETWKTPAFSDVLFDPANQNTTGTGFNPAEWIFVNHIGVFWDTPDGGKVHYKLQPTNILNSSYKYTKSDAYVGGNGVQCRSDDTDSNCLMPRGSYGWEIYHGLNNLGSTRGRISASGVMMPLKWVVTGTIY